MGGLDGEQSVELRQLRQELGLAKRRMDEMERAREAEQRRLRREQQERERAEAEKFAQERKAEAAALRPHNGNVGGSAYAAAAVLGSRCMPY